MARVNPVGGHHAGVTATASDANSSPGAKDVMDSLAASHLGYASDLAHGTSIQRARARQTAAESLSMEFFLANKAGADALVNLLSNEFFQRVWYVVYHTLI